MPVTTNTNLQKCSYGYENFWINDNLTSKLLAWFWLLFVGREKTLSWREVYMSSLNVLSWLISGWLTLISWWFWQQWCITRTDMVLGIRVEHRVQKTFTFEVFLDIRFLIRPCRWFLFSGFGLSQRKLVYNRHYEVWWINLFSFNFHSSALLK